MLESSDKFLSHLRSSHQRLQRGRIWLPDEDGIYQDMGTVGIAEGSLSIDGTRDIRRQATLKVSSLLSTLVDLNDTAAARDFFESLTANSAEIDIELGIRYPDMSEEWINVARLRIEESTLDSVAAALNITAAYDAGTRVSDFGILLPWGPYTPEGVKLTYLQAIKTLVDASYPSAHPPTWIIDPAVDAVALPPDGTAVTGSRWTAIKNFAQAINVEVYADHMGRWVIEPINEAVGHVWSVTSGEDGVLVGETTTFSRREQYNAVGIRWESPTGSSGLVYVVDNDPKSPTYYDGPFGRKPRPEETNQSITEEQQAIDAAWALLAKTKGKTRGIDLTILHNPLLVPGDVLGVYFPDGTAERHVIDVITLPLGSSGASMALQTRMTRSDITYEEADVVYEDARYTYAGWSTA